jgi:hypothetical protein
MSTESTGRPDAAEPFDPTNGVAGDTMGESDGTAEGELKSAADRGDEAEDDDEPGRPIGDGNRPAILNRVLDDD